MDKMSLADKHFEDLIDELIKKNGQEVLPLSDKNLIVVHHLLPTHLPLFKYLAKVFNKVVLIAIPYSLDFNARELLAVESITIESPRTLPDLINTLRRWLVDWGLTSAKRFLVFEVGGYSCEILVEHADLLRDKIEGVVEDTEQGLRLHERCLENGNMWWQVFSVARSPLKVAEDALTGDAVIFSLERQIRLLHDTLNLKNVLVMGFGKIGKHLSLSLKRRKTKVLVYDIDPYKLLEAYSSGFEIRPRKKMLKSAEIIIGATGSTSIKSGDFELLKDSVFLVSASSKTIEFDLNYLENNAIEINKVNESVDQYVLSSGKRIYLMNGGAPINFIDLGIIGFPLELVWIECLFCLLEVFKQERFGIFELQEEKRRTIAERWIEVVLTS